MGIPTVTRVDANLGIDSEIGVNAKIHSGLKIPPQSQDLGLQTAQERELQQNGPCLQPC